MATQWIKHAALIATLWLLAACSSGVKLNDVPVEDKTGKGLTPTTSANTATSSTTAAAAASPDATTSRTVQPLDVTVANDNAAGPGNAAKIIYFDYDSYSIKPEFQIAIEAHAKYLSANKARKMAIEGHTDERGGREYNLALGQKRSEAVRKSLALLGVSDNQIEAVSFGKEKPAASGAGEAIWSKNRRAEINYR